MDLKARLATAATALIIAGCTTITAPSGRPVYTAPKPALPEQAPGALSIARDQLKGLPTSARIDASLQWADQYLGQERAADAEQLLADIANVQKTPAQRYRWLVLKSKAQLANNKADATVGLLNDYESHIRQYPAEQQAQLDMLRADALAVKGELIASLEHRVAAHPLLEDEQRDYNHSQIWLLLMQMPKEKLEQTLEKSSGDLRGWLSLAQLYRDPFTDLDTQVSRLDNWSAQWRAHPATEDVPDMLDALRNAAEQRPHRVAVLLPLSGPLAAAGKALQDGIMTAYYEGQASQSNAPTLTFYDSNADDVVAVYRKAINEGAELVLGPLSKSKAAQIAQQGSLPVPTLALNYIDASDVPASFFQFGLAPEDEARQIARRGAREGHKLAGVLYPDSEWGRRVARAFVEQWETQGGMISGQSAYTEDTIGETVKAMLQVEESEQRAKAVSRFTNLPFEYNSRSRDDMDFLFLVASPNQGRQIKPALNYHYAENLPVYATALIYGGEVMPQRDQDLNGVHFVDMPWTLGGADKDLKAAAEEQWPEGHGRYERLYAMGIDAYQLQGRLHLLQALPSAQMPGVTGRLTLNNQRIVRHLDWAQFRNGKPVLLPQVTQTAQ